MPYASKRPEDIYLTSFLQEPGQHDEWAPYEDTPEEYLEAIRHKNVHGYMVKTTKAGKWLECEMYPIWKRAKDAPKESKEVGTSEAQQQLNDRKSIRRLARKINANFTPHIDYWCTFTSDNEHLYQTEAEGDKEIPRFLDRLRYLYRKYDTTLKYAYTLEYTRARDEYRRPIRDADGNQLLRLHIHMALAAGPDRADTDREVRRRWVEMVRAKWKAGWIRDVKALQDRKTGFAELAGYIGKEKRKGRRRYSCSNNLVDPQPTRSMNNRKATKTAVRKMAGDETLRPAFFEKLYGGDYAFVDCEARYNRVNDGTYLYCRMQRKDKPPPGRKRKRKSAERGGAP